MVIWLRRLAWGVGAVLLLWVIAWLALPPLIKWQLPLRASEALGRTVTIGDVSVRPWSLELAVSDLAIAGPAPGDEPLLRIKRVRANAGKVTTSAASSGRPMRLSGNSSRRFLQISASSLPLYAQGLCQGCN